jgi:ankyrin repeat protein
MDDDLRLKASLQLFDKLECCSSNMNGNFSNVDAALALVDRDKMRRHIMNCLTALYLVETQIQESDETAEDENYELVKGKVFNASISMINDDKFDSDEAIVSTILSSFSIPDEGNVSDERSWLPQHFALALGVRNRISEDDLRIMLSVDPLPTQRLSKREGDAVIMCDESGRCALHLVAQYSENLEQLGGILQIDHKMTKIIYEIEDTGVETTPLGLLCSRPHFPTFDAMVSTLIEIDSSVEVISDGIIDHIRSYNDCLHQDTARGSRGAKSLILLGTLLDANPAVAEYDDSNIFHEACTYLRGELGRSVLSLFLSKNGTGVKVVNIDGYLPIHYAALDSSLEVVKFLHKAYPESISMVGYNELSLLHRATFDNTSDIFDVLGKVEYVCDQCPALIHLKDGQGDTALHNLLASGERSYFECVRILCDIDATVVKDKSTPSDITSPRSGMLPLHFLLH